MADNTNKTYDEDERERLVARVLAPEKCPSSVLYKETGISQSILATWKSKILGNINCNK